MLLSTLLIMAVAAAEPATPATLESFFKEFSEQRADLASLRADCVEKSVVEGESTESPGKLLYIRPHRIIRKTQNPPATTLMDGRRAYLYEPEVQQVQIFDLRDDPRLEVLYFGFDENIAKLEEAYDMVLIEEAGQRGLRLTPKFDPHADPLFEELKIFFEASHLYPARIVMIRSDGGKLSYELSNYAANSELDPSETQIVLPEGTAVIENDRAGETIGVGGRLVPEVLLPGKPASAEETAGAQIEVHPLEPLTPAEPAPAQTAPAPGKP